jgi:HSP20 family molecular chaperone IbpA
MNEIFNLLNDCFKTYDVHYYDDAKIKEFCVVPYNEYKDKNDDYHFAFDLCGVSKEDIEITKKNDELTIKVLNLKKDDVFYYKHKEIEIYDEMIATILIDNDYEDEPIVTYDNGLLDLKFKLKEEEKPKKITIK